MKKSLPIGMIVVILLLALAATGIAYGYWTDQVVLNGSVQNGTLNVEWGYFTSDTYPGCTYTMSEANHKLTVSATNAYPSEGYNPGDISCAFGLWVFKNKGTIPVKLAAPVIGKTGPDYWTVYPGSWGAPEVGDIIQPNNTADGAPSYYITFLVPPTETGNEGATSTLTISIDAGQVNDPSFQ